MVFGNTINLIWIRIAEIFKFKICSALWHSLDGKEMSLKTIPNEIKATQKYIRICQSVSAIAIEF